MIFRLSQKLNGKIKAGTLDALAMDDNPFADWSSHIFIAGRTQYIIICNTKSLYSTVMFAKGIATESQFIVRALGSLREFMEDDGQEFAYQWWVAQAHAPVRFARALNRSVTGSLNDLIYHATMYLVEDEMAPNRVGFKLNNIPFSPLAYANPREAFKALAAMPVPVRRESHDPSDRIEIRGRHNRPDGARVDAEERMIDLLGCIEAPANLRR